MQSLALTATLLVAMCAACARSGNPTGAATTRDSASIRIIENQAPAQAAAAWKLDSVPVIDLGGRAGDPNQEFSQFVMPFRLADGRFVVANGGSNELRFFGADGVWQRNVGRHGSGPGEFEQLGWLDVGPGDTLRTYDWNLRRVSIFSSDGAFIRPISLRPAGEALSPQPVGVLSDGRLIVRSETFALPSSKPGVHRDTVPLHAYDESGQARDALGRFPGTESLIETGKQSVSVTILPFGKALNIVVSGSRLYVGTSDTREVLVLGSHGAVERIVRWAGERVPVTQADIDHYIEAFSEGWQASQETMRQKFVQMLKQAPYPKWKPAYAGLLAGPEGTLWVRRYTEPDRTAPTRFEVFDSTGRWLGGVGMPAGYNPTQITAGFVVGTWKDPDDVMHIRAYRLLP